ncbi:MAG: hypothetical protein ABI615_11995 [Chthoniobacterales bacterium]
MKRIIPVLFFLLPLTLTGFAQIAPPGVETRTTAPDPNGALAAIQALPAEYRDGLLKLSADNGKPNPKKWYVVAQDGRKPARNFTIIRGAISNESSGLIQNVRSAVTGGTAINLNKVKVDNIHAWHAAQTYCASKGSQLGSVSYALQQSGKSSTPIWYVWCYTKGGNYLGYIQVLATTGAVIFSE